MRLGLTSSYWLLMVPKSISLSISPRRNTSLGFRLRMTSLSSSTSSASLTLPSVSSKILSTLDPCVVLMKEMIGKYSAAYTGGEIYSLAQGVVYWKPPDACTHAMVSALQNDDQDLHMYGPDEGLTELRELLVQKLARENGLDCHDVMITAGANQAYVNCVLTLLGDETARAIVFAPYYFNHVMALQMTISNDNIVCGPTSDDGIPDLEWLQTTLSNNKNIRLVTLTNPGNPTGTYLPREYVQQVVDLCRKHRVWLILDTTYEYFVVKNVSHVSDNYDNQVYFDGCFNEPHVLHIFSFSKSYALAGYRCGYVAVHKESNIFPQMLKVQDTIPIAPSRIAQIAAFEAISSSAGPAWVKERYATLNSSRTAIVAALSECSKIIMGGNGAMYVMAKLPQTNRRHHDDVHVAEILVKDHGVAVIPGSFCGAPGWIRVCYANLPPETCLQAATRLKNGLRAILEEDAGDDR